MKSVLIGILISLLILGGGAAYLKSRTSSLQNESRAFANATVKDVVDGWNVEAFFKAADPVAFKKGNGGEEEVEKLFGVASQLGELKTLNPAEGSAGAFILFDRSKPILITANYEVKGTFEKGPASFLISLAKQPGGWKIEGFHINSPAFKVEKGDVPETPIEPEAQPEE